jgi:ABC-type transport system involved in multi-copper enzyme maturation permease subunit
MRAALVGALLAGLAAVWWAAAGRVDLTQTRAIARAGEWYFTIVVLAQLSMVLLCAPASTAGAFSSEMARGHVSLMLITGLTAAEIVLGTLCARLMSVLATVASVVPVLALAAQLGGIAPQALVRLEIITAGTAVLACALTLAVSIGAQRLHETLMTSYALLAGWVLGYAVLFTIQMTSVGRLLPVGVTGWFRDVNPYWLALEPIYGTGPNRPDEPWLFLAGSIGLSLVCAGLAAWQLTPARLTKPCGLSRRPWLSRLEPCRSFVGLDSYPLFWRECRLQQPSRRLGWLWWLYVAGALFFTALAVCECATFGPRRTAWAGPFNGFQVAVGLLLLSLVTPAALAEERARGSLEVLLATPITTRSLVLAKWCAYYRVVPALSLLPAVLAAAHAAPQNRWLGVPLASAMVLAQGAAVTSLGIALATWVPRVDRALILSAAVSVFVTVAWVPIALVLLQGNELGLGLASASPLLGVGLLTSQMAGGSPAAWQSRASWGLFWTLAYSGAASGLLWAALFSFDRCLGRIAPGRSITNAHRPSDAEMGLEQTWTVGRNGS